MKINYERNKAMSRHFIIEHTYYQIVNETSLSPIKCEEYTFSSEKAALTKMKELQNMATEERTLDKGETYLLSYGTNALGDKIVHNYNLQVKFIHE